MEIKVINLADRSEYILQANKLGENIMLCPVCSHQRKKKTDKCFSFNLSKSAGRCNHCQVVLVEKRDKFEKPTQIEYKRPFFKSGTNYSIDAQKFFTARKISEKTLLELKVTEAIEWMPKTRLEIPTIQSRAWGGWPLRSCFRPLG